MAQKVYIIMRSFDYESIEHTEFYEAWDNEADAIRETDELNREADSNEEYYFFEEELRGNNASAE